MQDYESKLTVLRLSFEFAECTVLSQDKVDYVSF